MVFRRSGKVVIPLVIAFCRRCQGLLVAAFRHIWGVSLVLRKPHFLFPVWTVAFWQTWEVELVMPMALCQSDKEVNT